MRVKVLASGFALSLVCLAVAVIDVGTPGAAPGSAGDPLGGPSGGAPGGAGGPPPPPPARKIPAITAEDQFPGACVSCHINYTDLGMDTRLSTIMGKLAAGEEQELVQMAKAAAPELRIEGDHPDCADSLQDIPNGCLGCHDRDSAEAPPFARLMHRIHLVGGEQNHFLTLFQGECTHCHKLDAKTGGWLVPSGPEA